MRDFENYFDHFKYLWNAFIMPKFWLTMTAIQSFISVYIFNEWNFAIGFFIVLIIDTWSGIYVSWRLKVFSVKKLRDKLMDKSLAYFSIILSYSVITKITLTNSDINLLMYLDVGFYSVCATAEFFSIVRNWYRYKKWPVLKKLMTHFKGFDDDEEI